MLKEMNYKATLMLSIAETDFDSEHARGDIST